MKDEIYSFVFKGLLAEEALDKSGRLTRHEMSSILEKDIADRLSLKLIDEDLVAGAKKMATVYTAIAAFENSVRDFILKRLLEVVGEKWWDSAVPEKIRNTARIRRDEEAKIRWHTPRGDTLITYTDFSDLQSIIFKNWNSFEDHLQSQDWVKQIFTSLEKSRNVIMHSGELDNKDIERVGTLIRDWIRQVGA